MGLNNLDLVKETRLALSREIKHINYHLAPFLQSLFTISCNILSEYLSAPCEPGSLKLKEKLHSDGADMMFVTIMNKRETRNPSIKYLFNFRRKGVASIQNHL
jgi:hypothetical protein